MTSITTETTSQRPALRSAHKSILGFLAGFLLAGTLAVGINVTSDGSSAAKTTPAVAAVHGQPSGDSGCLIVKGRC
jgi:hypothetical protein